MTEAKKPIYLARGTEVSGPFTQAQIDEMRSSGDLYEYSWYFDGSQPEWAPVIPPPSKPPAVPPLPSAQDAASGANLLAVCHDFRNLLSGKLENTSLRGCTVAGKASHSPLSPFKKGGKVWLNLLDETSGSSENVPATVEGCRKRGGWEWEVTLSWDRVPELARRSIG